MADTATRLVTMPTGTYTAARSFRALAFGKIYIGKIDTDPVLEENRLPVYVENESGDIVQVAQPLSINLGGHIVVNGQIVKIVTTEDYSMSVYNAFGVLEYYFSRLSAIDPQQLIINLTGPDGAAQIGVRPYGTVADAVNFLTPEMFLRGRGVVDFNVIQECADYASASGLPVHASGEYFLTAGVTFNGLRWRGGTFTATGMYIAVSIIGSDVEGVEFNGPYAFITGGGNTRFHNNKLHNQTFTAALFIRSFETDGRIDCCYNKFSNCNYAILQQGTSTAMVLSGRFSFNEMWDIHGDGIELNVVQKHYPQGLVIEGNMMGNVDGTGPAWGIGIGIAGGGEYGIDVPDDTYVSDFIIRDNHITGCRQCIHVEKGRDFTIQGNRCNPDTTKSSGSGLYFAAVAIYGCKDFVIDGVSGEPSGTANRFILIEWGVNNGAYAGPPRNFTLRNITTLTGDIEVATAGANDWSNTTIMENCRCRVLEWRGLPASSIFRNVFAEKIDCIGQHAFGEGSGGGKYVRTHYTYTNWSNFICLNDVYSNVSITKMYCDRIDEAGNNFVVPVEADNPGWRGTRIDRVVEQYLLEDDTFPGGREFAIGTVLHKRSGGHFLVTQAGAYIKTTGTYVDRIKATVPGQTFISANMLNWAEGYGTKSAGCRIVIPGAGTGGADLDTTIIRAPYAANNAWTVDIDTPIQTATPDTTIIRALHPVAFVEV